MLKKLASGEYSLKVTFWVFGFFGTFLFTILTTITHNGVLRSICPYGRICSRNIILYILTNVPNIMTGSKGVSVADFMPHLLVSACFVCYMYVVLKGLWTCAKSYEGHKFWALSAKLLTVTLVLYSLKSII